MEANKVIVTTNSIRLEEIKLLIEEDCRWEVLLYVIDENLKEPTIQHLDKYIDNLFVDKKFKYI